MINLIGLLDGIIGLDYWMVFFHPTSDVAMVHSSQGRCFFLFFLNIPQKVHIWSNKLISGPDFLKNCNMLSDFITQSTSKYETYAPA